MHFFRQFQCWYCFYWAWIYFSINVVLPVWLHQFALSWVFSWIECTNTYVLTAPMRVKSEFMSTSYHDMHVTYMWRAGINQSMWICVNFIVIFLLIVLQFFLFFFAFLQTLETTYTYCITAMYNLFIYLLEKWASITDDMRQPKTYIRWQINVKYVTIVHV